MNWTRLTRPGLSAAAKLALRTTCIHRYSGLTIPFYVRDHRTSGEVSQVVPVGNGGGLGGLKLKLDPLKRYALVVGARRCQAFRRKRVRNCKS